MDELLPGVGIVTRIGLVATGVLAVVWLATLIGSMLSRGARPKSGIRRADLAAITASFLFAMSIVFAMKAPDVEAEAKKKPAAPAAVTSRGTCASIRLGMKSADVRRVMGEPDEMRSEEDVRGPKAEAWVYKASRCTVRVLAGRVELVD